MKRIVPHTLTYRALCDGVILGDAVNTDAAHGLVHSAVGRILTHGEWVQNGGDWAPGDPLRTAAVDGHVYTIVVIPLKERRPAPPGQRVVRHG